MAARVNYMKAAQEGVGKLRELSRWVTVSSGLETVLLELVRLRASEMNGCHFCIEMHTDELKKLHEPEGRIAGVAEWRGSDAYTQRERAALAWTEAVTDIQDGHADDAVYALVREHFDEKETAALTMAIAVINAWNRMEIGLGDYPGHGGRVVSS